MIGRDLSGEVRRAALRVDPPVGTHDDQRRQPVPLAHVEVVGVVGRGDLDRAGAERRIDEDRIADDRDLAIEQRRNGYTLVRSTPSTRHARRSLIPWLATR